jgi:hypothetical protein
MPLRHGRSSGSMERDRHPSVRDAHSLRHTFIYLAGVCRLELPLVQSLVAHMAAEMTKMYMDHASDEAKRAVMQRMPNFLGEAPGQKALPVDTGRGLVADLQDRLESATVAELRLLQEAVNQLVQERGAIDHGSGSQCG